jgi:hypothetical protein
MEGIHIGVCLEGVGAVACGEELWAVDGGVRGALHGTCLGLQVQGAVAGEEEGRRRGTAQLTGKANCGSRMAGGASVISA